MSFCYENTSGHSQLLQVFRRWVVVPDQEFQKLIDILQPVVLPKGSTWVTQGVKPHQMGFLVSGLMRLYYTGPNGAEYTKDFCTPGDFVSPYTALLTDTLSDLNVEALEESELLVVRYTEYRDLTKGHSCWATINQMIMEGLFLKKDKRERDFLLLSAGQRYQQFVETYPDLHAAMPLYYVASYLGISPVSLSRIRARRK